MKDSTSKLIILMRYFLTPLIILFLYSSYHHTFPWDYATSEYGIKFNLTTMFIDFFAWIGWAYDRKKVSKAMVQMRKERTGDGSGHDHHH